MPSPGANPWNSLLRWPHARPVAACPLHAGDNAPLIIAEPTSILLSDSPDLPRTLTRAEQPEPGRGWLILLGYDAGRIIEPRAQSPGGATADRDWPLCVAARIDSGWLVDHDGRTAPFGAALPPAEPAPRAWTADPPHSLTARAGFERAVSRVLRYIREGDVYQVNLAHRLSGRFDGCTRSFAAALALAATPRHGAYLEFDRPGRRSAIASASPELYMSFDAATRRLSTRPMKGTRPPNASEQELHESAKDRAELNMIVDLMRNDLGRVCDLGSVRVDTPRTVERHGSSTSGVLQATATVSGDLRPGLSITDALTATFPPGSVTGAPKIRAMQIIDELEPVRRGPYCGCIGFLADNGDAWFNVAIRTALLNGPPGLAPGLIAGGVLDYSVGAGIVADSDPSAEWDETITKAQGLLDVLHRNARSQPPPHSG